jgi:Mg-chelatase subunit ChlD
VSTDATTSAGERVTAAPQAGRRHWLPWRRDRQRHLSGALVSLLFHLALLLLLASFTFGPGSGLIGRGAAGLGEASIRMSDARQTDLDARDLLKEMTVDPLAVPQHQQAARPLPQLRSLGPPPTSNATRLASISTRFQASSGVGNLSGDFGSLIGRLRRSGLDVALVIDSTGSMQQVIDELTQRMGAMVGRLQALVPTARVGAVAFRDRGDEYVVRYTDLSFHADKVRGFLSQLRAEGGGDWEEGVREGLESAVGDLNWRQHSKKVIILVGSSPPHKEDMPAVRKLVEAFHARGGIVSTIDITQRLHHEFYRMVYKSIHGTEPTSDPPMPAFYGEVRAAYADIARHGGGEMAGVKWDQELTEQILVFAFGSRWRDQVLAAHGGGEPGT